MAGGRKDLWLVTVSVGGRDLGTFDGSTGGKLVAASSKWREGGLGPSKEHGNPADREDMTCTRRYDFDRDHAIIGFLDHQVGKRDNAAVKRQPLDEDGNPYGTPRTYTGTLLSVDSPETDSNDPTIDTLKLDFGLNEVAA